MGGNTILVVFGRRLRLWSVKINLSSGGIGLFGVWKFGSHDLSGPGDVGLWGMFVGECSGVSAGTVLSFKLRPSNREERSPQGVNTELARLMSLLISSSLFSLLLGTREATLGNCDVWLLRGSGSLFSLLLGTGEATLGNGDVWLLSGSGSTNLGLCWIEPICLGDGALFF